MAQVTRTPGQIIGSMPRSARRLAPTLVGVGALAVLSVAIALFAARPSPASVTVPAAPAELIDGWMLSAPRGVGTAGDDVIDGWQLSAPRGVGTAGDDVIDGWQLSAPRGVGNGD
ncbi:MAG: hypothetical protein ACRDHD_05990 [Candidatus Limnocylindria bacterium]